MKPKLVKLNKIGNEMDMIRATMAEYNIDFDKLIDSKNELLRVRYLARGRYAYVNKGVRFSDERYKKIYTGKHGRIYEKVSKVEPLMFRWIKVSGVKK